MALSWMAWTWQTALFFALLLCLPLLRQQEFPPRPDLEAVTAAIREHVSPLH